MNGPLISRPRMAALATAALLWTLGPTSSQAQFFHWNSTLSASQIERMVQASGYRLTGPVTRNGAVYLANVLGSQDDPERLVLDATDGRLLQRFIARHAGRQSAEWPTRPRQQPVLSNGWLDGQEAYPQAPPLAASSTDWLDNDDGSPPPRPPVGIYGDTGQLPPRVAPLPVTHAPQVARADEQSGPRVILAPPAAGGHEPVLERPRMKPQVKRHRPDAPMIARPSPAVAPIVAPEAKPAAVAPEVAPTAPAPRVADTKAAAPIAVPEVAPAPAPAPAAPVAKAPAPKPALNDVPVAPLQ
jgi:hypothetical protein